MTTNFYVLRVSGDYDKAIRKYLLIPEDKSAPKPTELEFTMYEKCRKVKKKLIDANIASYKQHIEDKICSCMGCCGSPGENGAACFGEAASAIAKNAPVEVAQTFLKEKLKPVLTDLDALFTKSRKPN